MAKLHGLHFELLPHPPILWIWLPETDTCLQTLKECSRKRDVAPMENRLPKLKRILKLKINRLQKRHQNVREALE